MASDFEKQNEYNELPEDGVVEEVDGAGIVEVGEETDDVPAEVRVSQEEQSSGQDGIMVKYCIFCKETILADASTCKYCGHVVSIFEGGVFKQLWWFFWAGVMSFLGVLLPFYGGESVGVVSGYTTFAGSFYLLFSIMLIFAMSFSIYSKRLVMGPVFLMFVPAIHTWWIVVKVVGGIENHDWYSFLYKLEALELLSAKVGSGLILLLIGSSICGLTFIFSLFSAVSGGGNKGGAPRGKGRGRRGR